MSASNYTPEAIERLLSLIEGDEIVTGQPVFSDTMSGLRLTDRDLIAAALHPDGQAAIDAYHAATNEQAFSDAQQRAIGRLLEALDAIGINARALKR